MRDADGQTPVPVRLQAHRCVRLTGSLPPCRVEKLWVQNGATFFFGPIFIHPEETAHEPTKMFYKKEVFLSNLEETLPMTCVLGTTLTRTHTHAHAHAQTQTGSSSVVTLFLL